MAVLVIRVYLTLPAHAVARDTWERQDLREKLRVHARSGEGNVNGDMEMCEYSRIVMSSNVVRLRYIEQHAAKKLSISVGRCGYRALSTWRIGKWSARGGAGWLQLRSMRIHIMCVHHRRHEGNCMRQNMAAATCAVHIIL